MGRIAIRRAKTNKQSEAVLGEINKDVVAANSITQGTNPVLTHFSNGNLSSREYFKNGVTHRDAGEGPAYQSWYDNNQLTYNQYFSHGKLDRDPKEGPAVECFFRNGNINYREFRVNGQPHRDPKEGPAIESWHEDGTTEYRCFYIDGHETYDHDADVVCSVNSLELSDLDIKAKNAENEIPQAKHITSKKIAIKKVEKISAPVKKLSLEDMTKAIADRAKRKETEASARIGTAIFAKDGLFVNAYTAKDYEHIDTFVCGDGKVKDLIDNLLNLIVFLNNHKDRCFFRFAFENDEMPEEVDPSPIVESAAEWLARKARESECEDLDINGGER